MPLFKRPSNPVPRNVIPALFRAYKVRDGDTLESIAKSQGMEVWELIYENFKTTNPSEANWYLKNYVGCTKETADKTNLIFSSTDKPGIIYIPLPTQSIPPQSITPSNQAALRNVWAGFGKAHSGDLAILGAHDLTGIIYNLGDGAPDMRNATLNINGYKFGFGLGASIGAVLIIAYGYPQARDMTGASGGWDYDAALGVKLGDLVKAVKGFEATLDTLDKYKKIRYVTENTLKTVMNGLPGSSGIITLPIPFAGGGLHVWGGFKYSDIRIFRTGTGIY